MLKGKTTTGFEYEVNDEVLSDMEFIDALSAATTGQDGTQVSIVVQKLFGSGEQRKRLYDHVRKENGIVPAEEVFAVIEEILSGDTETKKS